MKQQIPLSPLTSIFLHCPPSFSLWTTANKCVGVTYVNYPASAVTRKRFCVKDGAHTNTSQTTVSE